MENKSQAEIQFEKLRSQGKEVFSLAMGTEVSNDLMVFLKRPKRKYQASFCIEIDDTRKTVQFAYDGLKTDVKLLKDGTAVDVEKSKIEGSIYLPFEYRKEDQVYRVSKDGKTLYLKKYLDDGNQSLYLSFDINRIKDQNAIDQRSGNFSNGRGLGTRMKGRPYNIEHIVNCLAEAEAYLEFQEQGGTPPQEDLNP
ncbi:hypothetical protein [Leptospira yasudae]|uniref:hypothetical protein n=1 Tax=Leptospira yasudae TaxID=2202201 RepID=UPI0011C3D5D2|nr:hypothetical protein [Leptospira yasudae]